MHAQITFIWCYQFNLTNMARKPARILQHKNQGDSNIWSYQNILFTSDFIITLLYFPLD